MHHSGQYGGQSLGDREHHHVYVNAMVVISVSRVKSADEGFLGPRTPIGANEPYQVLEIPFSKKDGTIANMALAPNLYVLVEPIDERAWTLQERVLASRCLEFGALQTRWACLTIDKKTPSKVGGWEAKTERSSLHDDDTFGNVLSAFIADSLEFYGLWNCIVEIHSGRHLGFEQDRLVSLAAIAARFGALWNDEYLCGFWKRDIRSRLPWGTYRHDYAEPTFYIAPSWSWASFNSRVLMGHVADSQLVVRFHIIESDIIIQEARSRFGALISGPRGIRVARLEQDAPALVNEMYYNRDIDKHRSSIREENPASLYLLLIKIRHNGGQLGGLAPYQRLDGLYFRGGTFSYYGEQDTEFDSMLSCFHSREPETLSIVSGVWMASD
ncbi:hypothetical protein BCR34DRAFT_592623 [Clohesyomyces aquaticus]|uniref:Heterokaryon incompatibility domain-containing protein n=1 Tax=Clohesyomyces aquaticus TaxID=1231657 RepID=A0A1Y1YQK8_9PLEO|nr:hypothetical protein BCR34DRAFT_592623 [Clohesyomyces aquaticus]